MKNPSEKRRAEAHVFDVKQQNMLRQVSEDAPSKLNHFKKAYVQKSLRSAITAKCLECVGFESAEVRRCAATACPLWAVRPYQEVRASTPDEKAKSDPDAAEVFHENEKMV